MDVRQDVLDRLGAEGWAGLEIDPNAVDKQMKAMMAEAEREAAPIAAALSTPQGRHLLDWLIVKTLFRPSTDEEAGCLTADRYAILKARRDGQNGVVWMLLHALQVARREERTGGGQ